MRVRGRIERFVPRAFPLIASDLETMTSFSRYPGPAAFPLVNRYVMVLTPLQPYVDWIQVLNEPEREEGDIVFSLEEAHKYHRTSYLVPYAWEWDVVEEWLNENYGMFFENELEGIEPDKSRWPEDRTRELFDSWFEAEIFDAPFDTTREPMFTKSKTKKKRD
jgi:hypothetical protein